MAMEQIIVATDPGKSGSTVIYWGLPRVNQDSGHTVYNWKGEGDFIGIIEAISEVMTEETREVIWFVEQPPKTTGMKRPESTGFVLGENFGFIKGAIMAGGIPMKLVRPQKWQSLYSGIKGKSYNERKEICFDEAKRLYPSPVKVTKKNADAWLILEYAKQTTQKKQ